MPGKTKCIKKGVRVLPLHTVKYSFCPTPLTFVWTNAYAQKRMRHIQDLGCDWDDGKREKCQKHGLALEEIEAFFRQERLYVAPDIAHSQEEQRLLAVGRCPRNGRPMCVVFTLREKEKSKAYLIRPSTARYMHEREAKKYGEEE